MPLFMVPDMMPLIMKFKDKDFEKKDITHLMQCIWTYLDAHGKNVKRAEHTDYGQFLPCIVKYISVKVPRVSFV